MLARRRGPSAPVPVRAGGAVSRGFSFGLLAMAKRLYPHKELLCASGSVPQELTAYLRKNPAFGLSVIVKTSETAAPLARCAPFTKDYPSRARVRCGICAKTGPVRPRKQICASATVTRVIQAVSRMRRPSFTRIRGVRVRLTQRKTAGFPFFNETQFTANKFPQKIQKKLLPSTR